jgi:hypothetical protein
MIIAMISKLHFTLFKRFVVLISILFVTIFTTLNANADHFTSEKYQSLNKDLLQKMWDEQLTLINQTQKDKKKRIFYTGFALWGGEKWALGDAIKLGSAFKKFYDNRTFFKFIFSNNEVDFLPDKYPTVFEDVVAQHFEYLQVNSRDDDLIIIGLYSHGLEEKLIIRLGKGKTHAVTPTALKKFLDPISKKNVLLIISACHAGSFIPYLISDNIAIAVAAAADKQSNGCSPLHSQTFYGKNLSEVLNSSSATNGDSIFKVMEEAASQIAEKEKWKPKSEPSFFTGKNFSE